MSDHDASEARERWEAAYRASSLRDVPFETMSGVPMDPVYGDPPLPRQYPYTRGVYASMYRSKLWTMRMFAGFGTADDTNARFQELAARGRHRPLDRVRHADADGPRLRRPRGRSARSAAPGVAVDTLARHARTCSPASTSASVHAPR